MKKLFLAWLALCLLSVNAHANEYWVSRAIAEVQTTYGDTVSVDAKNKRIFKFGSNSSVGASEATIADLGSGELHETYVSDNLITHISSSSTNDAQALKLECHTVSGGVFTFMVQDITLAGQTKTALTTPCARVSRLYNNDSTALEGAVYVYEDVAVTNGVPQTASAVHITIPAGKQQSFKAATTISNNDYYFITEAYVAVSKKSSASVDAFLEIRLQEKVFREQVPFSVSSNGTNGEFVKFEPYIIVPKNADVRMVAIASTTGVQVVGAFNGLLASIIN